MIIPGIEYRPSLASATGKNRKRNSKPVCVVVHFTGAGVHTRWVKQGKQFGEKDPFDTAVRIYQRISPAAAHYVVGQNGQCVCTTYEDEVASHVGSAGHGRYNGRKWREDAPWWPKKWPELPSPRDLAAGLLWASGSVNEISVGIEVTPSAENSRPVFSEAANKQLQYLCKEICKTYGIPYDKYHVFAHCDAHPISRTAKGESWDVLKHQWDFSRIAG